MAKHVAVVGAGLGGLRAAEQLRAAGHTGPVTVVGAEPHLPYSRPPLSKELLARELPGTRDGARDGADDLAALHERVAFRRRASIADVTFLLGTPVTAADLAAGKLTLADGAVLRFDGLVAATGLRPRQLSVPGPAGPGSGRHVVRTLDDCLALRAALAGGGAGRPRVVVVGGGFVGCEVARTALALGCAVTVVEPAGPPMLRVLGAEVAGAVQRSHERAGITFVTGRAVVAYTGQGRVSGVVLADGTDPAFLPGGPASGGPALAGSILAADLLVEAVGSLPNTGWLDDAGLDLSDGIRCDNHLAAVGQGRGHAPAVAVGDVARFPNPLFDDVPRRVEHWSMPADTARRAAATLHATLSGDPVDPQPFGPLPSFWSDQGDLRLQSFGCPELADDVRIAEGDPREPGRGLLATYHRGGRLVGSVTVNLPPSKHPRAEMSKR
jgi:NADPH-dependent 2,4-dienoyl-CoA reductase/sulfur reductase-like enzyme